ncbi:MAG: hypothetical protein QM682_17615 [Paracoccus sp. (in: a-proteobacteria)]|uniref:hypothetical protein n=1 Tax=Paracoccus sp. TaxID=267 RepID=UPI0039E3A34D
MIRTLLFAAALMAAQTGAASAQAAPPADELLALTLYVQQDEEAAIQAELRRLRLKYPQWAPPSDLSRLAADDAAPQALIAQFQRQLAAGRIDQARETLAQARRDNPGWTLPPDMAAQLETAEGQQALDQAIAGGDVAAARSMAARTPGLLRCDRINNAWRIAEGQAAAGARADALATYRAVLGACTDPGELVSTLEKADVAASEADLRGMAAQLSGRFPAEAGRFDAALARLLAGRGVAPPAKAPAEAGKPARRAAAQPTARGIRQARAAPAHAPRGESPAQCAARTAGARAAGTVLKRGWCVYDLDRTMDAMADFKAVLAARPNADQRRDAQYGLALSYLKLGMSEPAAQIAATADFDHRQRVDVERQILDQRGVAAYEQRRYREAIRYFDAIEQITGALRRDLAMLRAYAYLNAGSQPRALAEFRRLNAQLSTAESRRGLRAASGG